MKKLLLSLCLALFLAVPAMAAIDSSEVQSHIGEQQTVCGTVAQVAYLRKGIAINMGNRYPYQHINGFIWNSNALSVGRGIASGLNSYDELIGKNICISGQIVLYKGRPEIIINTPGQISVK